MMIPRQNEVIGQITECLAASHFRAECTDGMTRMLRIPGRLRRVKVKTGYWVLVKKWLTEPDEKGDIVWCYRPNEVNDLRRRGFI